VPVVCVAYALLKWEATISLVQALGSFWNKRLQEGIKTKDMDEIALAQAMLATVRQIHSGAQDKRAIANATEKRVEKRTYTLIGQAIPKKSKK